MDLLQELLSKNNDLSASIQVLKKHGIALAQAEHDYKVKLSEVALQMKADNRPVTFINLIIHGDREVAEKRLKRDIARTMYDANQEHINVTKLQIRIIENQLQREYHG